MKTKINGSEVDMLKVASDYCIEKGVKSGLSGVQHAAIQARGVQEVLSVCKDPSDLTPAERKAVFEVLFNTENGSALRQKLEKLPHPTIADAKVLTPKTGGKGEVDLEAVL